MTNDVVISVKGLGKKYLIGHETQRTSRGTLRDAVVRMGKGFARTLKATAGGRPLVAGDTIEEFWALRDVSFEVKRGEVLGIIGRNGAGKSTLLKILSRITDPSEGRVMIHGRVASLLEVGTGFHPELTGRENIFLNGAILGMTRAEIRRKFEEIVAFSGVERFLDTPVKRYSSGMYVRLAFAVAAHLEPEILIVDEVLAVGDLEFQKKCLAKMSKVATGGRTVLFVSHNLDALRRTCESGILLSEGRVKATGALTDCIEQYLGIVDGLSAQHRMVFPPASGGGYHVIDIEIFDEHLQPIACPTTWQPVVFAIRFFSPEPVPNGAVTFQVSTTDGLLVTFCSTRPDQNLDVRFEKGINTIYLKFDSLALSAGTYVVGAGLAIADIKWLCNEPYAALMDVSSRNVYDARLSPVVSRYPVPMPCRWERSHCAVAGTELEKLAPVK
jgi:ABC-type polysaccharide/polyol phosphate transport system ATPase subunit